MNQQLIEACRKNDSKAQKCLYDQYAVRMFRLCFRYLKNEAEAEDAMLKGFLKVFQKIAGFENRHENSLESWIRAIMVNECLMCLRSTVNFHMLPETEAEHLESDISIDSNWAAEEIYQFIRELPAGYRTVFNLYALEGYSHKEIAGQLQISEGTSKSQLSKARALLKKNLIKRDLCYEKF